MMQMKTTLCIALLAMPAIALAQVQDRTTSATNTALTLYNEGAAVVQQTRDVRLDAGRQSLSWPGAPLQLLPNSLWVAGDGVALNSATIAGSINNSPMALLASHIGEPVTLLSGDDNDDARQAVLISVSANNAVVRVGDRLEMIDLNGDWRIAWPAGEAAPDRSALQLTVTADNAGAQPLTLIYQQPGLNWHASYTARYDASAQTLALQSLAVISNNGRDSVHADQVALIAGDVNRSSSVPRPMFMARSASAAAVRKVPEAVKTAGGYYRYELDEPVDLAAGATQLLPLMNAQVLEVGREYYIGDHMARGQRIHARIRLHLENTAGKPLPAGTVRVYGSTPIALLGEDRIGDTPKGAPVTLSLGEAFDITAVKHVVKDENEGETHRRTVEITVFNASDKAVNVTVAQRLPKDADILSESIDHQRKTPYMAEWAVSVPATSKNILTYALRWAD